MWGWLIALAVISGLAILPLGISAKYNAGGPVAWVIAGPVRLKIFPAKKKEKKQESTKKSETVTPQDASPVEMQRPRQAGTPKTMKEASQSPETKSAFPVEKDIQSAPQKTDKPDKGGSILEFLPLVQIVLDFLGEFGRKLRVDRLELKLILAGDDPCDLAVNYGRAWAAVGNLFPLLERTFVIKKRDVEVECDFTSDETLVVARLDLTITLGRLLSLAVRHGIRALLGYLKIKNSRKGGALK